jgi:hypothetical protein
VSLTAPTRWKLLTSIGDVPWCPRIRLALQLSPILERKATKGNCVAGRSCVDQLRQQGFALADSNRS